MRARASVLSWIAQPGPTGSVFRSASIKEFRVRWPQVGRGQTRGPCGQAGRDAEATIFSPPTHTLFVPSPVVCSIWEIYGGSINGFYRQLLERAEQGLAVGGPSLRLTAKTLKYYGRTYIKIMLGASSAASLLLTQEPENGQRIAAACSCWLCKGKCPQLLAPAPAEPPQDLAWAGSMDAGRVA